MKPIIDNLRTTIYGLIILAVSIVSIFSDKVPKVTEELSFIFSEIEAKTVGMIEFDSVYTNPVGLENPPRRTTEISLSLSFLNSLKASGSSSYEAINELPIDQAHYILNLNEEFFDKLYLPPSVRLETDFISKLLPQDPTLQRIKRVQSWNEQLKSIPQDSLNKFNDLQYDLYRILWRLPETKNLYDKVLSLKSNFETNKGQNFDTVGQWNKFVSQTVRIPILDIQIQSSEAYSILFLLITVLSLFQWSLSRQMVSKLNEESVNFESIIFISSRFGMIVIYFWVLSPSLIVIYGLIINQMPNITFIVLLALMINSIQSIYSIIKLRRFLWWQKILAARKTS